MATKAQIARSKYGTSLSSLSPGEKAAVTRAFNAQSGGHTSSGSGASGAARVEFGRIGVNGTSPTLVSAGTTIGDALEQADVLFNSKKEGVQVKGSSSDADGTVKMLNDAVEDGVTYVICPGIDSNE